MTLRLMTAEERMMARYVVYRNLGSNEVQFVCRHCGKITFVHPLDLEERVDDLIYHCGGDCDPIPQSQ